MRVIVMRDDISPVDFSHPLLFKPAPDETVVATATAPSVVVFDSTPQPVTAHHSLSKIAEIKTAAAQAAANKADAARIAAAGEVQGSGARQQDLADRARRKGQGRGIRSVL